MHIVVHKPTCTITFGGPTEVDLGPYLIAVQVDEGVERVDARTFARPRISDVAPGQDTITLALRWSAELYELLLTHEGQVGDLVCKPHADEPDEIEAEVSYDLAPVGAFTIGASKEEDLVLAVHDGVTLT